MNKKPYLYIVTIIICYTVTNAQDTWDNQLYTGTRIAWGKGEWKQTGEFQVRLLDDVSALDRWYLEYALTYLPSEHWELTPDIRYSIKSSSQEIRPGLGGIYKVLTSKFQFANQVKWQGDYNTDGTFGHGVRWAMFLNYMINETFIPNFVGGVFYRWGNEFTGWEFLRFGAGVNIRFDPLHILNLSYFLGALTGEVPWQWSGIFYAQLTIRITDDWKYIPANIINF